MKQAIRHYLLFCILSAQVVLAVAAQGIAPDLAFNLGNDLAAVRKALNTAAEVEPMESTPILSSTMRDPNAGKTILHLRTRGIWVFFSAAGKAETIRLDAPYSGSVNGMKLGDSLAKLMSTHGQPIKRPESAFLRMTAYRYALDDSAYVTFHVNDEGIQYIFLTR